MIGREVYYNPYLLASIDRDIFNDPSAVIQSRKEIVEQMFGYIETEVAHGTRLHAITRHMLGLFAHCHGARSWRRQLSEQVHGIDLIENDQQRVQAALECVQAALAMVSENESGQSQSLSASA
jgi:tRNA-dihydrouridine synthase A